MHIQAVSTPVITPGKYTIESLLDEAITELAPKSVVAITSKIISLCEGAVVDPSTASKEDLIHREADYYMPAAQSKYGINFTITQDTLIPNAGIDESNAGDVLVLWPKDPQATANRIRAYLGERFGVSDVGVVITDSTCRPLRKGVSGIAVAHSGFKALHDYVGEPDLFGRPFKVAQSDIAGGLAATAVMVMGEGAEATPIAVLGDADFVTFVDRDPTDEELAELRIPMEEDLFAPFLQNATWEQGGRHAAQ